MSKSMEKRLRVQVPRIAELEAEVERLRALVGLCRAHYATPMDPAEDCDGCVICLLNRVERLRTALAQLHDQTTSDEIDAIRRIESLEAENERLRAYLPLARAFAYDMQVGTADCNMVARDAAFALGVRAYDALSPEQRAWLMEDK